MSPEQIRGDTLDGRSDVYSLGIVLYELTTGRAPYRAETPPAIFVKHLHDPLLSPRQFNPALPEAVEWVILKSLTKERGDRLRHGHLDGSTVVLSGCSAGRGRPTGADVLGLTSAFLYAGAVGIVAGLWRVDDIATAVLMAEFYRGLGGGADTAGALRQAQLGLLRDERHSHPYYWVPFGLSGDGRASFWGELRAT